MSRCIVAHGSGWRVLVVGRTTWTWRRRWRVRLDRVWSTASTAPCRRPTVERAAASRRAHLSSTPVRRRPPVHRRRHLLDRLIIPGRRPTCRAGVERTVRRSQRPAPVRRRRQLYDYLVIPGRPTCRASVAN